MRQKLFDAQLNTLLTVTKHKDYSPQEIETLAHIYFRSLKNIPDAIWLRAVEEILLTEEFFPTIHKLHATALKFAGEEDAPPKMEAWSQVVNYIERGWVDSPSAPPINPLISTAVNLLGGWNRIGHARIGYEQDHIRNEFFSIYDNLVEERKQKRFPMISDKSGQQKQVRLVR